jgi:hypothetical protein
MLPRVLMNLMILTSTHYLRCSIKWVTYNYLLGDNDKFLVYIRQNSRMEFQYLRIEALKTQVYSYLT